MMEDFETKNEQKELLEPSISKEKNLILGKNQNHFNHVNPEFIYPVDEQGYKLEKKLPDQELIVSHYWAKKRKQIGILGAVSALLPFSILTQETGIFDSIFKVIAELFMAGVSIWFSLF